MAVDPRSRIEDLLAKGEKLFARRFLETISSIRDQFTLEELERLLQGGQFETALAQAELASKNLANAYVLAYIASAEDTAKFLRDMLSIVVRFDQSHDYAISAMRRNQLRLVREFTQAQREATRFAILDSMSRGESPRQQALAFRNSIGLTRYQLEMVQNYRETLERGSAGALDRALRDHRWDRSVEVALRDNQPIPAATIDRMVNRYQQNWIAFRAETIARTEALPAVHLGVDDMYRQAVDQGVFAPDDIIETWHPARDKRTRDSHEAMRGQQRPFGQPFLSGLGNYLRYPGDEEAPAEDRIHCRCVKTKRLKEDAHLAAGVVT